MIDVWVEKYRPNKLEDVVLEPEVRELITSYIEKKRVPDLLLVGEPGTGKTTLAKVLIKELDADSLMLNASDERGIDIVRNKVKQFLMFDTIKPWKIVFLDEADYLTNEAQNSLRNMMETYSEHGSFILTANYKKKIIKALQSRCEGGLIEFKRVTPKGQFGVVKGILDKEKIEYDEEDLLKIIEDCDGDLRRVVHSAQRLSKKGKLVYKSVKDSVDIEKLLDFARKRQWNAVRSTLYQESDYQYILRKLFDYTFDTINKEMAVSIVGEYLYRDNIVINRELNTFCCVYELGVKL